MESRRTPRVRALGEEMSRIFRGESNGLHTWLSVPLQAIQIRVTGMSNETDYYQDLKRGMVRKRSTGGRPLIRHLETASFFCR